MTRMSRWVCMACGIAWLSGCAVGPDYQRPTVAAADAYKEDTDWRPSEPDDALRRGPWWTIYHDDELAQLESKIEISNQNVKAAADAFAQAEALVAQARAGFWPTLAASVGPQRGSIDGAPPRTTVSAGA